MVSHQLITDAAASPWRWLLRCWRLRGPAQDLARAFFASADQVELEHLKADKAEVERAFEAILKERDEVKSSLKQQQEAENALKAEHRVAMGRAEAQQREIIGLAESNAKLTKAVERVDQDALKNQKVADWAARKQQADYDDLKAKHDALVQAGKNGDLTKLRDAHHLLKLELDEIKAARAKEAEALKLARDGNQALLRFIHTGHRLNVKFDAGSIRAALQKASEQ